MAIEETEIVPVPRRPVLRYIKFLVVGFSNAAVDLLVLNGLLIFFPTRSALVLSSYNTVAVVFAIINSYWWNSRWTFADTANRSKRQIAGFWLQAIVNIVLNDLITVWLSMYLIFAKSIPLFVSSNAAKAIAMFLSSSLSYLMMRWMVFQPGTTQRRQRLGNVGGWPKNRRGD
ncbi:GtrA family protein [Alicyclobacillus tolerans]|uniref:GtrA family protein n=1 Tax=Alicyclobacillus tolerans TaxID=90970 RepID=UPI001F3484E5|nr:GtrA family protein [Alicyclobacillus tolerans]MCF8567105.1 GtrA family protein [Alicyclobacillus tolerans]